MLRSRTTIFMLGALFMGLALTRTGDSDGPSRGGSSVVAPVPAAVSGSDPSQLRLPCPTGGYLCATADELGEYRIRRWTRDVGTLVVHVPEPSSEPPARARLLQSAAAAGVRAWNGHPYPVRVDLRTAEAAHFSIRWSTGLGGRIVGAARTSWASGEGLAVTSIGDAEPVRSRPCCRAGARPPDGRARDGPRARATPQRLSP